MIYLIVTLFWFLSWPARAVVDMKNANFSDTEVYLYVPGSQPGYELEAQLSYNSRSMFNGNFGFGWCSNFETRVEITPEGNMKSVECGAGSEIFYTPKKFDGKSLNATVAHLLKVVKERNPKMSEKKLKEMESDLRNNSSFREDLARAFNYKGTVVAGQPYYANGRENETLVMLNSGLDEDKDAGFKRTTQDGKYELFNKDGQLTAKYDRNGNFLKYFYDKGRLTKVVDRAGRNLLFFYNPTTKKVSRLIGPNNLSATFVTKGEDLVEVTDAWKKKFKYAYDDLHNMTKLTLPNGKSKSIVYNKDKDWVVGFTNEKGCVEKYDYILDPADPKNHFTSKVTKTCQGEITNKSTFEFFHKPRADKNGVYLARVKSNINGATSDVYYHEIFGKPVTIVRGNFKTEYIYSDAGMIKTKKELGRTTNFEYNNNCNKVSNLEMDYFEMIPATKSTGATSAPPKLTRKIKTTFSYDSKKCHLIYAENSDGMKAKIQYDMHGRIAVIEDQSKKFVKIKYDEKFGKPEIVSRPGLGTIKVTYKDKGEIKSVESKEGPQVAVQVASIFSNLLEIIAPASAETNL